MHEILARPETTIGGRVLFGLQFSRGNVVAFHRTIVLALSVAFASPSCPCVAAEAAQTVTLGAGTEARLVLVDALSSQTAVTAQKFKLALDQDIRVGGQVAVARGAIAYGTVINAKKSGTVGTSGQLNLRIDYLLVDGKRIPLFTAGVGKLPKNHELGSVLLITLFGPLGMFKKGETVSFPPGTPVLAYIDADTQIDLPAVAANAAAAESVPTVSQSSK
jgi:hypothetical protein